MLGSASLFGVNSAVAKVVLDTGTATSSEGGAAKHRSRAGRRQRSRTGARSRRGDMSPARAARLALLGMTGAAMIDWLYFTAIDRLPVGIASSSRVGGRGSNETERAHGRTDQSMRVGAGGCPAMRRGVGSDRRA